MDTSPVSKKGPVGLPSLYLEGLLFSSTLASPLASSLGSERGTIMMYTVSTGTVEPNKEGGLPGNEAAHGLLNPGPNLQSRSKASTRLHQVTASSWVSSKPVALK